MLFDFISDKDLEKLVWGMDGDDKVEMAGKTDNVEVLKALGYDEDEWCDVRESVASNPFCPNSLLEELAGSNCDVIRDGAALNPNVTTEILQIIESMKDHWCHSLLEENDDL